jgi:N-acyl-phosphatidylethanolamine-hydrolysing phospholipase D
MTASLSPDPGRAPLSVGTPGLPFLFRRIRATIAPREGAAPWVPFDRHALELNPSVTWIGHASLYVRMDGASFLIDPVWSDRCSPVRFAGPKRLQPPGVPLEELPDIDFAVLSHDHYDHTDLPTVKRLAERGVPFLVPRGMGDLLARVGAQATELQWWQSATKGRVRVHCVPAQHFSGRGLTDRNRRLFAGFVVEGETRRFYHAGDTAYFGGFAEIADRLGRPDLAALPIGAYEPRRLMGNIHQTPEEAVRAGIDLGAERLLGMHFGTFDLADEPLAEPPARFLAEAARRGLEDRAFVLSVGETRGF